MKKCRTNSAPRKARSASERQGSTRQLTLPEVILDARLALREVVVGAGLRVLAAMLEDDRTLMCGPKSQANQERRAYRHGHDEGCLVMGGRKVRVGKPRVRSVQGQELELPTWQRLSREDPLQERVLEQMMVGVSTRAYARSLEELPTGMETVGTSRTNVSRQFKARTRRQMDEFLSRPLGNLDLPVILLDGTGFGDHVLVVALGIDTTGRKHVLGVTEGSTESEQVCRGLLGQLIERGLVVDRARLFVIDGGKGLRKAIREMFGGCALIQRCQVHKLRNVMEHLPEAKRSWVRAVMSRAWEQETVQKARGKLMHLASQLEEEFPGAARSILEGLDETLTLIGLSVRPELARTLRSTNAIENLQGTLKRVTRNVKRWRGGMMALRWAVAAMLEAQKKFRRVKGYAGMPQFIAALESTITSKSMDRRERIA